MLGAVASKQLGNTPAVAQRYYIDRSGAIDFSAVADAFGVQNGN